MTNDKFITFDKKKNWLLYIIYKQTSGQRAGMLAFAKYIARMTHIVIISIAFSILSAQLLITFVNTNTFNNNNNKLHIFIYLPLDQQHLLINPNRLMLNPCNFCGGFYRGND